MEMYTRAKFELMAKKPTKNNPATVEMWNRIEHGAN